MLKLCGFHPSAVEKQLSLDDSYISVSELVLDYGHQEKISKTSTTSEIKLIIIIIKKINGLKNSSHSSKNYHWILVRTAHSVGQQNAAFCFFSCICNIDQHFSACYKKNE